MLRLLLIVGILLFLFAKFLPRLGSVLGGQARKPFRQAKWMWSWVGGTEDDAIQAEREYGRECAREFEAQFKGRASRPKQDLVDGIGSKLAAAIDDPRRKFTFKVAPAPISNAFALPGGFIFITEPLIDLCGQDPDQIAFFLGHEMGHVLRGHAKSQLTASTLVNAVTARLSGAGLLLQQVLSKGYSRDLELEADSQGVRLAAAAGFNSRGGALALRCLENVSPDRAGLAEYFASHPPLAERIRKLE